MNTVTEVANRLIPARIQRLSTLIKVLPNEERHGMTINEIVNRHVSALGLSGRTSATALRIIHRDLTDLKNEGQIQNAGGRPKKFFKTPNAIISMQSNSGLLAASNDYNVSS